MINEQNVMATVRKTRSAMHLTQTDFAIRLGKSLATVVRYETLRPPKGRTLAKLRELAETNGLSDLAEIFRAALAQELGVLDHEIRHIGNMPGGHHSITPQNEEEARFVQSLLRRVRSGQNNEAEMEIYSELTALLRPDQEELK
jgi:transcriptional regulator with XRE-family HTH domain